MQRDIDLIWEMLPEAERKDPSRGCIGVEINKHSKERNIYRVKCEQWQVFWKKTGKIL